MKFRIHSSPNWMPSLRSFPKMKAKISKNRTSTNS